MYIGSFFASLNKVEIFPNHAKFKAQRILLIENHYHNENICKESAYLLGLKIETKDGQKGSAHATLRSTRTTLPHRASSKYLDMYLSLYNKWLSKYLPRWLWSIYARCLLILTPFASPFFPPTCHLSRWEIKWEIRLSKLLNSV